MAHRIEVKLGKKPKVDLKDRKILTMLNENSRYTLNQIASKVLLSRDAVRYRIQRLQKLGVIQRFVPIIDYSHFDYNRYHLFLQLHEMGDDMQDKLFADLSSKPEVISVIEYTDNFDGEIVVLCESVQAFDRWLTEVMNKYHDVIDNYVILEQVAEYCNRLLPQEVHAIDKKNEIPDQPDDVKKVDELDIKILGLLSKDARASYYSIAQEIDLSSDAVSYRIKKMTKSGLIQRFSTAANLTALGYNWYTLFIQLRYWGTEHESRFREVVDKHPNILMAMKSIGEWNLLMYVAAKSQEDFHRITKQVRTELRDVIRTYETLLGYREHEYIGVRRELRTVGADD